MQKTGVLKSHDTVLLNLSYRVEKVSFICFVQTKVTQRFNLLVNFNRVISAKIYNFC